MHKTPADGARSAALGATELAVSTMARVYHGGPQVKIPGGGGAGTIVTPLYTTIENFTNLFIKFEINNNLL